MKNPLLLYVLMLFVGYSAVGQTDADKLRIPKSKIVAKLDRLALAQITINYKLTTTAKTQGKGNEGAIAGARVTAYLETTDGDLTEADLQEVTDYFYSYFQRQLKSNGIDTVAWSTITATDFYKNAAEKEDDKKKDDKEDKGGNVWMTSTAHHGNIIYGGGTPFAFGKIKKAASFCEDIGAPAGFFYATVDFADVVVGIEIKQTSQSNIYGGWYFPATTTTKYTWGVNPMMRVGQEKDFTLFWNKKAQGETMYQDKDIEGGVKYHDSYSEDASKARSGIAKQFAFRKEMTPVLIQTTRANYKAAAKKTLEKYADAFIEKSKKLAKD